MRLPELNNWDETRDALHQVAQVMSAIRVAASEKLPNDLHVSLKTVSAGCTTGELDFGGALVFDCAMLQLRYIRDLQKVFLLALRGHSQQSLMHEALRQLRRCGVVIDPSMKNIIGDKDLAIDPWLAGQYVLAQTAMTGILARVRGKLGGRSTPPVLWPHHFDFGFLWFPGGGTDSRHDPHIAFGFASKSERLQRPYVYAYAWSSATGYLQLDLTAPAHATTTDYIGLYSAYDDLRQLDEPASVIATMLLDYAQIAAPLLA